MRALLTFLLALITFAQVVWASAAGYCTHEASERSSRHLGHHAQLLETEKSTADASEAQQIKKLAAALDHSSCNLSHCTMVSAAPLLAPWDAAGAISLYLETRTPSPPPSRIERPKWQLA